MLNTSSACERVVEQKGTSSNYKIIVEFMNKISMGLLFRHKTPSETWEMFLEPQCILHIINGKQCGDTVSSTKINAPR